VKVLQESIADRQFGTEDSPVPFCAGLSEASSGNVIARRLGRQGAQAPRQTVKSKNTQFASLYFTNR